MHPLFCKLLSSHIFQHWHQQNALDLMQCSLIVCAIRTLKIIFRCYPFDKKRPNDKRHIESNKQSTLNPFALNRSEIKDPTQTQFEDAE